MPLSHAALEPLLRLALIPGIGPSRLALLLRRFGSAERVLGARAAEVGKLDGFGGELVRRLTSAASPEWDKRVERAVRALRDAEGVALTPDDLAYPDAFRTLPDSPFLLFAAGNLELLARVGLGIVGTRQPTPYGRSTAAALSEGVARAGYTVVSGMAKGIDAAAHAAALDAGGGTVGVLGQGIDRVYPAENRALFRRVRAEGLLISELPPGEMPRAGNFPRRNRLIAALSCGVVVVEMGQRSGAQHTVNFALEQGKEVFAVPGPIGSAASAGTNQLLKDGARLVTSVSDILEELEGVGWNGSGALPQVTKTRGSTPSAASQTAVAPPPDLSPDEAVVFAALSGEPRHVDELAAECGLSSGSVLAALLGLELREVVEALPGKHFRRASG